MITTLVQFTLPAPITRDEARRVFESTAPKYQSVAGLIRKYYVLSPDGATAGGIYLWQSRADADRLYTDEWKAFVRGRYGADPTIAYFETPVIVDNLSREILADE